MRTWYNGDAIRERFLFDILLRERRRRKERVTCMSVDVLFCDFWKSIMTKRENESKKAGRRARESEREGEWENFRSGIPNTSKMRIMMVFKLNYLMGRSAPEWLWSLVPMLSFMSIFSTNEGDSPHKMERVSFGCTSFNFHNKCSLK